jgi:hypothetical protein
MISLFSRHVSLAPGLLPPSNSDFLAANRQRLPRLSSGQNARMKFNPARLFPSGQKREGPIHSQPHLADEEIRDRVPGAGELRPQRKRQRRHRYGSTGEPFQATAPRGWRSTEMRLLTLKRQVAEFGYERPVAAQPILRQPGGPRAGTASLYFLSVQSRSSHEGAESPWADVWPRVRPPLATEFRSDRRLAPATLQHDAGGLIQRWPGHQEC